MLELCDLTKRYGEVVARCSLRAHLAWRRPSRFGAPGARTVRPSHPRRTHVERGDQARVICSKR
jgi:hypothetical protein